MAATCCASAGSITLSSMKQLHPLVCRSPSCMPIPHPRRLDSFFFIYLPSRFIPVAPTISRHRSPFSPFCGNGELEIVAIKELADGFIHFSFGVPSAVTNKLDDESFSTKADHNSRTPSVSHRLPSKFSKKSPIPGTSARQTEKEKHNFLKEDSGEAFPSDVKAVKQSLRPKSLFVKRSPIPVKTKEVLVTVSDLNRADVKVVKQSSRPKSLFVKQSPIPVKTKEVVVTESALNRADVKVVKQSSRPKSLFVKRSPIPVKTEEVVVTESALNRVDVDEKSHEIELGSTRDISMRPRSVFVRKSPIPSYINKHVSKPSLASPTSDSLINNVEGLDFTVKKVSNDEGLDSLVERSSSDAKASRPKSAFSRKSPIVKVNQLSRRTKNTEQQSLLRHKDSSENKSTVLLGGNMNDESCHNGVLELEKCKLTELKSIAKNRGLRGYSRLKKAELLALLKELDA